MNPKQEKERVEGMTKNALECWCTICYPIKNGISEKKSPDHSKPHGITDHYVYSVGGKLKPQFAYILTYF